MFVRKVLSHSSSLISSMLLKRHLMGGVVDEHVEPAEFLDGAIDQRAAMRRVGHVARHQYGAAAGLLDPARRLACVLILAQIGDQHIGALPRESDRDGAADAGIGSGDQRRLALQFAAALVGLLAVIGRRVEFSSVPGGSCCCRGCGGVGWADLGSSVSIGFTSSEILPSQRDACGARSRRAGERRSPARRLKPRRDPPHSPSPMGAVYSPPQQQVRGKRLMKRVTAARFVAAGH